ncbi:hypothetical protein D6C77_01696 [Aureobasidium pullulans]|uniref:Uncharacterized protein n=1 Tax=Aureobasidium pullulans TaxID=5580 RepID=A0AB74K1U3_AURPU|nr:hypothetical protein D6D12_02427 [Aureobasidium pullulans]TIA64040.1 hypothetical protein D6C77_01696 [Aureobasidium pullulans]
MSNTLFDDEHQKRLDKRDAADFIMQRGMSNGLVYDEQRAEFTTSSLRHNYATQLSNALSCYYNSDPSNQLVKFSRSASLDEVSKIAKKVEASSDKKKLTWQDVIDTAKGAEAAYNRKGFVRKFGRSMGDMGPAVVDKLDQAPEDMYIGVVCRGLKLIFGVAIQLASKRQKIFEAFEGIPDQIKVVQGNDRFFSCDLDYRTLRHDFDVCLLTVIGRSIEWLVKPTIWKTIEAVIKGPLTAKSVEESMDALQDKSNKLTARINLLDRTKLHFIGNLASSTDRKINEMLALLIQQNRVQSQEQAREEKKKLLKVFGCNAFLSLFETPRKARSQHILPAVHRQVAKKPKLEIVPKILHQAELTSFMAIPDGMFSDTTRIIQSSARFDIEEMKIAYAIAKSTDFLEWSNATWGILFLNGSGKITAARESSTSALFASLVIGTIDDPAVTVLHFFCGLHCNIGGVVSGPKGLMRSLIAQLSVKQNFDLNFIDDQLKREEVRDHDIHRLCETFSAMAFQLPADHEVCCLIEGISWLETPSWREDLTATIAYLCYLSVDPRCQARFKLLISCPVRSLMLTKEVKQYGEVANVVEKESFGRGLFDYDELYPDEEFKVWEHTTFEIFHKKAKVTIQ